MLMAAILAQMFGQGLPLDDPTEDPWSRATTPPNEFVMFQDMFALKNFDQFSQWIHEDFGLVTNGVLLTKDEAEEQFRDIFWGSDSDDILEMNFAFNYGIFANNSTFQADTWLEVKIRVEGQEQWFRMHHQLVFKIVNSLQWYLIQWEYIPADVDVPLDYQTFLADDPDLPTQFSPYVSGIQGSTTSMTGVSNWPLLLGSNYTSDNTLHPIAAVTPSGNEWSLDNAVIAGKPVVFYFFSVQGLSVALPEDFENQMEFLSSMYDDYGYEDVYIFGVTDDSSDELNWLGESGYSDFAPLLDEGSMMHASLNIDVHPYIVVFDSEGTVVALSKTYHPTSTDLLNDRILEAIASSN